MPSIVDQFGRVGVMASWLEMCGGKLDDPDLWRDKERLLNDMDFYVQSFGVEGHHVITVPAGSIDGETVCAAVGYIKDKLQMYCFVVMEPYTIMDYTPFKGAPNRKFSYTDGRYEVRKDYEAAIPYGARCAAFLKEKVEEPYVLCVCMGDGLYQLAEGGLPVKREDTFRIVYMLDNRDQAFDYLYKKGKRTAFRSYMSLRGTLASVQRTCSGLGFPKKGEKQPTPNSPPLGPYPFHIAGEDKGRAWEHTVKTLRSEGWSDKELSELARRRNMEWPLSVKHR